LSANQPFPPGYREPEEDSSTLSVVLDSFIPFLRESEALIPLPSFLRKKSIDPCVERGEASTSRVLVGEGGKDFAWSRALGIELSPVKTRSDRKKTCTKLKEDYASHFPTDGRALRDLKALERTK